VAAGGVQDLGCDGGVAMSVRVRTRPLAHAGRSRGDSAVGGWGEAVTIERASVFLVYRLGVNGATVLGPVLATRDGAHEEALRRGAGWTWVEMGTSRDFGGYIVPSGW